MHRRFGAFGTFFSGTVNAVRVWYSFFYGAQTSRDPSPSLHLHRTAAQERRRRARVQIHWSLHFLRPGATDGLDTVTQNLSSDGFYCIANTAFVPGETISCTLTVPTHDRNGGDRVRPILCRVRIIRVETLGEADLYGVGCRIEDYRFISACEDDKGITNSF